MPDILSPTDTTVGAGAFNRRISFQSLTDTPDGMGGTIRAQPWATTVSTWAHIEPWKGNETLHAGQVWGNMYVRFLIRYRPSMNINDKMRIAYGSRLFNVRSVSVLAEARTTIEIIGEELQATGSLH